MPFYSVSSSVTMKANLSHILLSPALFPFSPLPLFMHKKSNISSSWQKDNKWKDRSENLLEMNLAMNFS